MKIEQIKLPPFRKPYHQTNTLTMGRKYVQNDSFINAPNKNYKTKEINDYLTSAKKETKDLQKTARSHYLQCMGILKMGRFFGFDNIFDDNHYNITFGDKNEETDLPSSINIWENGRLVQQYTIVSNKPVTCIEVYDCENKYLIEEYSIVGRDLISYIAKKPQEKKIEMVIPHEYGFYKVEGKYEMSQNKDIIRKSKEIEYDRGGKNTYSEYEKGKSTTYVYDAKEKRWQNIKTKKEGILNIIA